MYAHVLEFGFRSSSTQGTPRNPRGTTGIQMDSGDLLTNSHPSLAFTGMLRKELSLSCCRLGPIYRGI